MLRLKNLFKRQRRKIDVQKIFFKVGFDDGLFYEDVIVGNAQRNAEECFEDLLKQWNAMGVVPVSDDKLFPIRKIQHITYRSDSYLIEV